MKRRLDMFAWAGVGALVSQFSVLAYCTWEVFAWDVMEPFCYFLGFGYGTLFYLYFAIQKKDYNYAPIYRIMLKKRQNKAYIQQNFNITELNELKEQLFALHDQLDLLKLRKPLSFLE